jgi:hypothetical protein
MIGKRNGKNLVGGASHMSSTISFAGGGDRQEAWQLVERSLGAAFFDLMPSL